jgi:tetratricopeptide (TPR) repeat protein
LDLARITGDDWLTVHPLALLGVLAQAEGDYARAEAFTRESLALSRKSGDPWETAIELLHLGMALRSQGRAAEALALHQEGLVLCRDSGDPRGVAWQLERFADLAASEERWEEAAKLIGVVDGLLETTRASLSRNYAAAYRETVAAVRAALGTEAFEAARAAGAALSLEDAADFALGACSQAQ